MRYRQSAEPGEGRSTVKNGARRFAATLDCLAEASVVASFSRVGLALRRRLQDHVPLDAFDLAGRVVVLSGATSGIGEAAARGFVTLGATLEVVARDAERAARLVERLKGLRADARIGTVIADLARLDDVRAAAATLAARHRRIDVLVHNAGALHRTPRRDASGRDLGVELMVTAPFLLTALLLPRLRPRDGRAARVVTMGSGGMYLAPLTVDGLELDEASYGGARQYALAKRAQVALNEEWARRAPASDTVFHAMHPGWVDTPGLREALPGFARALGGIGLLRTPEEGADTLLWLAAAEPPLVTSGEFWLDRAPRATHRLARTRASDTPARRAALWRRCERRCGLAPGSVERASREAGAADEVRER